MSWLFVRQLRPMVLLAGAVSLLLNLALLMPAIYMLQVFDRVFASRSVETLVMLSLLVALALALGYFMDTVRAKALAWAGRALDRRLSPAVLDGVLREAASPRHARGGDADVLRDVTQLRAFLGGSGIQALFDAPWLPIYLMAIALMHPLLGAAATLGAASLGVLGAMTERLTRASSEADDRALACNDASCRGTDTQRRGDRRHGHDPRRGSHLASAPRRTAGRPGTAERRDSASFRPCARPATSAPGGDARCRRVAGDRRSCVGRHHGRGNDPARTCAATGRAPDRRLEVDDRCALSLAAALCTSDRDTLGHGCRAAGARWPARRRACRVRDIADRAALPQ